MTHRNRKYDPTTASVKGQIWTHFISRCNIVFWMAWNVTHCLFFYRFINQCTYISYCNLHYVKKGKDFVERSNKQANKCPKIIHIIECIIIPFLDLWWDVMFMTFQTLWCMTFKVTNPLKWHHGWVKEFGGGGFKKERQDTHWPDNRARPEVTLWIR